MIKQLFFALLLGIFLIGCSASQTATIKQALVQFDNDNAKRVNDIMAQVMKHWAGNSIFWKIQIGPKLQDEDHFKLRTAWENLDRIYKEKYLPAKKLEEVDAFEGFSWFLKWGAAGGKELAMELFGQAVALAAQLGITV